MTELIKQTLNELGIREWSLCRVREETAELFFIRKRLDMRRMKEDCKYHISVFRSFEKDGKEKKGVSTVAVVPSQSKEELKEILAGAYYAASFVANPTYPLPKKVREVPVEMPGEFEGKTLGEIAMAYAEALFTAEKEGSASILNSAEFFAQKREVTIATSEGTDVGYTRTNVNGEYVVQCKEPEDVEMHHTFEYDGFDPKALHDDAERSLRTVYDRAIAKPELPSGNYDLILSDENLSTVMEYYVARTSAQMIYPKYSLWKIGDPVQGENVKGEKLEIKGVARVPYSAEGIPMKDRKIIEGGKVALIHGDNRFSSYLGIEPTGTYRAVEVENGTLPLAEMKKTPYLYPVAFSDFQMDEMDGSFKGEIRLAYWFDGKTTRIVTGGSVNGMITEASEDLVFSLERYHSAAYRGPFAVKFKNVKVAGTV